MTKWLVRHSWRLALVAGLGGLLALAAACGGDDNASTTPTKTAGTSATATGTPAATGNGGALKIGALLSFTGGLGTFGQPIYNGIELAVD